MCETINPGPAEQSDCGNRLCMSVIGKSGGESETAASAILSVCGNVQPSSQMIWASVYQKTPSRRCLDRFIQETCDFCDSRSLIFLFELCKQLLNSVLWIWFVYCLPVFNRKSKWTEWLRWHKTQKKTIKWLLKLLSAIGCVFQSVRYYLLNPCSLKIPLSELASNVQS